MKEINDDIIIGIVRPTDVSAQNLNTAVEKHGLILMYTAQELDINRDVHTR